MMMPSVTRMDPAAHRNSNRSMMNSATARARLRMAGRLPREPFAERSAASLEHRPDLPVGEPLSHHLVLGIGQRDVSDFADERRAFGQIEVEEAAYFGPVQRF